MAADETLFEQLFRPRKENLMKKMEEQERSQDHGCTVTNISYRNKMIRDRYVNMPMALTATC